MDNDPSMHVYILFRPIKNLYVAKDGCIVIIVYKNCSQFVELLLEGQVCQLQARPVEILIKLSNEVFWQTGHISH